MSHLLLHIGYHKTATTFLQNRLFNQARYGFSSPVPREELRRLFLCADPFDCDPVALRTEVQPLMDLSDPQCVAVLSHEQFSGRPAGGGFGLRTRQRFMSLKEIADLLHGSFPEARVLIVVREQRSMVASAYKFLVNGWQGRLSASIEQFLDQSPMEHEQYAPLFEPESLCYHRLVGYYQKLFGQEAVLVLPYEWMREDRGAFINRIRAHVGLPATDSHPMGRANVSTSALECAIARPLKRLLSSPNRPGSYSRWEERAERLAAALARPLPKALHVRVEERLRRCIAERLEGFYAESNAELARLTGIDLRALGYELPGRDTDGAQARWPREAGLQGALPVTPAVALAPARRTGT